MPGFSIRRSVVALSPRRVSSEIRTWKRALLCSQHLTPSVSCGDTGKRSHASLDRGEAALLSPKPPDEVELDAG